MFSSSQIKLIQPKSPEPENDITFNIDSKNDDIHVIIDFGDGSEKLRTREKTVVYQYSKHGLFQPQISVCLGCEGNNVVTEKSIRILSYVEKPSELDVITPKPTLFGLSTSVTATLKKGSFFNCTWDFGDQAGMVSTIYKGSKNHTTQHKYTTPGVYQGSVSCFNRKAELSRSFEVDIQEEIKDLMINEIAPQSVEKEFKVTWKVGQGFPIDYTVMVNGVEHAVSQNGKNGEATILPSVFQGKYGEYEIKVSAVNEVTSAVTATKIIVVHPTIRPVSIMVPKHTVEVNESVTFTIDSSNPHFKDYPQYEWDFGDKNNKLSGSENKTAHKYAIYGSVLVKLTTKNPVSSHISFVEIKILRPVIKLEGLTCAGPPTVSRTKAELSCSLDIGSDFTCSVDWDGEGTTQNDFTDLKYYLEHSTAKDIFRNLKFKDSFIFDKAKEYIIRTTCNNRLYQVSLQTKIVVQDIVKDVSISDVTPQSFGNVFRISWQASGTDVQYKIYWNGQELADVELVDGKPSTKINKGIYKTAGVHKFIVEAWNKISESDGKEIAIIIEEDVKNIDISIISAKHFLEVQENVTLDFKARLGSNPHYRISFSDGSSEEVITNGNRLTHSFSDYGEFTATVTAYNNVSEAKIEKQIQVLKPVLELGSIELHIPHENVSESAHIIGILSQGSDFTCHVDFGDGQDQNTKLMYSSYYTNHEERNTQKYKRLEIEFSHAYSVIKTFELTMTCTNRKGNVSVTGVVSIFKPLVPFKIQVPVTNEQNKPIPIHLSQENDIDLTKHEFEIDFGDNNNGDNKLKTQQNNLQHSYTEFGEYTIVVVAKSPVSSITVKQKIVILKPVVQLKNLRLLSVPVNLTEPIPLSIRLGEGSDFKCSIKWNSTYETIVDMSKDLVYYANSSMEPFKDVFLQARHIFTTKGHHQVLVTCSNRLGSVSKDIVVITQIALKGFFIKPIQPQEFGKDFNIFYEIQRGSELKIKCEFNGKAVDVIRNEKRVQITPDLYTMPGLYNVTFIGSNLVSSSITRRGSVIIDERIRNVTISGSKLTLEVNQTTTFDFGSIGGSAVVYDIDFNDGTSESKIKHTQREHHFKLQGVYTITVTAYNSISKVQSSLKVTVLKPVLPLIGLTLEAPHIVNISSSYTLKLLLGQGSDFDCTIDSGNEDIDNIPNQKTEYYTSEPYWSTKDFTGIVMSQKKSFPKVGELTIKATCTNRLHEIKAQLTINVYVPISDFTIETSKNTIEVNETIYMEIKGLDGVTTPVLNIDSGKHGKRLTTKQLGFKNSFTHHGQFNVNVNASNPASTAEKQIKIDVLKPVLKLNGLSATARPNNLSDESLVVVTLEKGSDFSCKVIWGDSQQPESQNFENRYNFYDDLSLNEKPFTTIEMKFKHIYKEIGEYHVDIECSNRKNKVSTQTNIIVQTPISGFKLIEVSPQRFGSSFQLKWVTDGGSNIEFIIFWEETTMAYQRSVSDRENFVMITPKDYTTATIHRYTICAKNKVSHSGNLTSRVIIEEDLEGLKVELSKYQEVEVNETIIVSTKLSSGNNPHFKYYSGDGIASGEILKTEYPFSYTKQGTYKVKVHVRNNVSRVQAEASMTVIKPVLPITKVLVRTDIAYDRTKTAKIDVIISSGSDFKCLIMYGDGTEEMTITMNTDYYQNGKMENLDKFKNTKHSFHHNYTVGGVYTVQVTCSNRVSSKSAKGVVFVQGKIDGLFIFPITPKKVGEEFLVKYQATQGTNLTYFVHFQNKVYRQHSDRTELKTHPLSSDRPGVFSILINATNHISGIIVKRVDVIIEDPIQDLEIHSPTSNSNFEVGEEFEFCYSIKQGSNPHFTADFDGSVLKLNEENTKAKFIDGSLQFCFKHSFVLHANFTKGEAQLELNLKVTAKNNVTSLSKDVNIIFLKPVLDIKIHSFSCNPITTGNDSRLIITLSGSDLICTWTMETKDTVTVPLSNVFYKDGVSDKSKFANLQKTQVTAYRTPGAYKANIKCGNRKSTESLSTVCLVQDAITGVEVEAFGSKEFGKSHDVVWREEKGTNITYIVKINGKSFSKINKNKDGGKHVVTLPEDIVKSPGDYQGEIVASNLVTENLVTKFMIRLERKLQIKDVEVTYENGKTGQVDQSGHGDGTYYPVRKDIVFSVQTNAKVFNVEWTIILSDNKTEFTEPHKSFVHRFEEHGTRTIKYRVSNNISSAAGEMELNFIEAAGFVVLTSNTPQWIGYGINFTVFMPEKGQETCFRFDAGDGNVYYYTTEKGDCREFFSGLTLQNITGIFPKHQDSLLIFHNYTKWNFYTAHVTAVNHLSKQNASTKVLASQVICNFPTTNITNLGISPFYPTRLARSEKMTVYLDAELDCAYISKVKFKWAIYKYNAVNGKLTPVVLDNRTYTFDPYLQKDLIIKKKSLPYGVYLIKSTITMDDPKAYVFSSSARGYLHVYPSALVAAVEGGALIRRGFGKAIPFSGGASCDPDINKNNYTGKRNLF